MSLFKDLNWLKVCLFSLWTHWSVKLKKPFSWINSVCSVSVIISSLCLDSVPRPPALNDICQQPLTPRVVQTTSQTSCLSTSSWAVMISVIMRRGSEGLRCQHVNWEEVSEWMKGFRVKGEEVRLWMRVRRRAAAAATLRPLIQFSIRGENTLGSVKEREEEMRLQGQRERERETGRRWRSDGSKQVLWKLGKKTGVTPVRTHLTGMSCFHWQSVRKLRAQVFKTNSQTFLNSYRVNVFSL